MSAVLRPEYLRKKCGGDEGLRREVESALAQEKRGERFPGCGGSRCGSEIDGRRYLENFGVLSTGPAETLRGGSFLYDLAGASSDIWTMAPAGK